MSADKGRIFRRVLSSEPAICLILALAACAAYIPVTRLDFLNLDDHRYVVENPWVLGGFTWSGVRWAFTSFDPDNWFPLTRLSHMLDYALFGLRASWHHGMNVLVHAFATAMLYGFLRRATRERWPSIFVAAVFALHPLHVESVAWISERKDVLCAFFWFATLWAWVRYSERPSKTNYALALALFAAGLMSKPMIVTLPLLLLIVDMWPLRRPFSTKLIVEKLPFLALSAVDSVLTLLAQNAAGAVRPLHSVPATARIGNALASIFIYIGNTFWPASLSNPYSWPADPSIWLAVLAALTIVCISALTLAMRRERPYLAAGWFWFLLTLLPVIGLVQVGLQARADRYMYVPMTGLSIVVAWGAADILRSIRLRSPWAVPATAVLAVAACLSLAALTWRQQQYWETVLTLYQHAIAENDQNYLAWAYLGSAQVSARVESYTNAVEIRPDLPELRTNLGEALLRANRVTESIREFEAALRISPGDTRPRCLLGVALLRVERVPEAISAFEALVRNEPDSAMAHNDLAVALSGMPERSDDERRQLERAVALPPDYSVAHSNLGLVLLDSPGGLEQAVRHFIQALSINPKDVAAHLGLAKALATAPLSDPEAATAHLNSARELEPDPEKLRRLEMLQIDCSQFQ